ncbi:S1C family serine protease [Clostridium sp.]|jgi:serine protease Do|uniref:S1C family serine protease n=1 Tax=Clostridium sp. TaxID=1506 RepID=UPI003A5BADD9
MDGFNEHKVISSNDVLKNTSSEKKPFNYKFKFRGGKFLSFIAVALISSLIGGFVSAFAFLYVVPNTSFFKNTPLYESIASENTSTTQQSTSLPSVSSTSSTTGNLTVAQIAKKVSPAVVCVSVKSITQSNSFFGSGITEQDGMGSGIIINSDGYILTNYHVVQGAETVTVTLSTGKEVPAKVVNYNANQDLAIIKVTEKTTMPAVAELGDSSKVEVGDPVVAIGNPLGKELSGSVTSGIISAKDRQITVGNTTQTFIQTDAAINEGNSGGALVNSQGQVIGVNSAKIGGNGVEGIGFAIPINTVKSKLSNLLKPALTIGIICQNSSEGVYVEGVQESSPAEKAGIQSNDIIQEFDGKNVYTVSQINAIKAKHKSGDVVSVVVLRNGETKTLKLTLEES